MTRPKAKALPGLKAALIVLATLAAYGNSFSGPFLSDDLDAIVENPTIRSLWPIRHVLSPPHLAGETVGGRPVLNLSLAINYAFGGLNPKGYHALNLAIHVLAALTLFGCVRRTLEKQPGWRGTARPIDCAFAIAAIWAVHPLQTESVTYIVQRAESLMGLFYLLTLYCFIRHVEWIGGRAGPLGPPVGLGGPSGPALPRRTRPSLRVWAALSVLFCLLGMATKEVMVSAPVMVLLYDRTFVSGSFGEAWRKHRGVYAGLAGGWLILAALVVSSGNRGGSMGFGIGVKWGAYLLTQFPAVAHYLRLAIWPRPLIFDYGVEWVRNPLEVLPAAILVAGLAAGAFYALSARSWLGFLGAWFFAILAPTSLVPASRYTLAEHRMYLALIPLVAAGIVGVDRAAEAIVGKAGYGPAAIWRRRLFFAASLALGVGYGAAAFLRNRDYRADLVLWTDTAAKRPTNPHAHDQLGSGLASQGRMAEAIAQYEEALRLKPDFAAARFNLANTLDRVGRAPEAIGQYEAALRIQPNFPEGRDNLANVLVAQGRISDGIEQYREALRLKPEFPMARNNLGNALAKAGRLSEAIEQYQEALRIAPEFVGARYDLGNALVLTGRLSEAIDQYSACLRVQPDYAEAHHNLGVALRASGRNQEAQFQFAEAARIRSNLSSGR